MSKAKYIAFDFETGGLDPQKNPILTGYFLALDSNLLPLGELDLKVKPDPKYMVEQEALDVSGIILDKHLSDPESLSMEEAGKKLLSFLEQFGGKSKKDKDRPKPLGHNIAFDINFISQLIPMDAWGSKVHYSFLCTSVFTNILKDSGVLPDQVGNLESLVKYFNVQQREAHVAKNDILMTVDVYAKMTKMIKDSVGGSSGLSIDVLSMLEK